MHPKMIFATIALAATGLTPSLLNSKNRSTSMSKQESGPALDLLKDLMEENPLASEKAIMKLFKAASRGNADIEAEIIKSVFDAEYRSLMAAKKH